MTHSFKSRHTFVDVVKTIKILLGIFVGINTELLSIVYIRQLKLYVICVKSIQIKQEPGLIRRQNNLFIRIQCKFRYQHHLSPTNR